MNPQPDRTVTSTRDRQHRERIISGTITTTLYRQWLDREEVRRSVGARWGKRGLR
jgi:hypothetical protein